MKLTDFRKTGQELLEFKKGVKIFGSSYIQRIGAPGHYTYVYPSKKFERFGRRFNRVYSRFIKRNKKLIKSIGTRYEATSMNLKPKTWNKTVLAVKTKHKGVMDFQLNMKKHTILLYRARTGTHGNATNLAKMKRKGILRYR